MRVRLSTQPPRALVSNVSLGMAKSSTNIEIDNTYVEVIMDRYGVRTKTEAVDLALRHLSGQPTTREEALAMEGAHAICVLPSDYGPHDVE